MQDNINTYTQFICYFFLIIDEIQCNNNSRDIRINRSVILRSHGVYISFTIHFALCIRSLFISVYRIPFSAYACAHRLLRVSSLFAQHVRSPFTHSSSWKIKRFSDCLLEIYDEFVEIKITKYKSLSILWAKLILGAFYIYIYIYSCLL